MDFDDSPEEAAFRAEVRRWLASTGAPPVAGGRLRRRSIAGVDSPEADAHHVELCREWQRTLYAGGWAGITWPREFGGRGGTPGQQTIFNQEQARYDVSTGVFAVAIGMVGPTLIAHGTDEQRGRHLDSILRGDTVWCQLFSEPGAGSDLASLSTRAESDGDEWVVNGQKVWNSGAHHSQWGILLARTDRDVPKHAGITYFLVDMRSTGVEVRPLRQITGAAHFNEVFLTDVRIPSGNIVGKVNEGWNVARTTLTSERALIGGIAGEDLESLTELARAMGPSTRDTIRHDIVRFYIRLQLLTYLGFRVQTALSRGTLPGPEGSVLKLAYSRHLAATSDLVMALTGARGMLGPPDGPDDGYWSQYFLNQWSSRLGGGTDEIQRNVIGERALLLPREPSSDGRHG